MAPPINAKVSWGAAGAAGGTMVGGALADLITSSLIGMGLHLTEKNMASIDILTIAALAYGGSFLVGYLKSSGLTVKQQVTELKETEKKAKEYLSAAGKKRSKKGERI